jgi:hypothetical protein
MDSKKTSMTENAIAKAGHEFAPPPWKAFSSKKIQRI